MPRSSVVIPAHGREGLTGACLAQLGEQRLGDTEVVVVEDGAGGEPNGGPPTGTGFARRLALPEQVGFAAACNAGAAATSGEYLVFLNNDTLPAEGWLDALVECAMTHPRAGVVGAKVLWPDNTVQHAGVVFDSGKNGRHLYLGLREDHPAVNRPRRLQAVTAAAMLVRSAAFEEAGGFDASFVNGWEDIDLCLRARERGWEVRYEPGAVVYHLEGATRGRDFEEDGPNYVRFMERWGERIETDDVAHYAADGLLEARHAPNGLVEVLVSPELGGSGDGDALASVLAERTGRLLDLEREQVRLALAAEPPVDAWGEIRRRRVRQAPPAVSVLVPLGDHDTLGALLVSLARQSVAGGEGYEVILSSEGDHLERTLAAAGDCERPRRLELVDAGSTGGRAAHFNRAIERASGEIVVLLADDFVPADETFVEAHLALHAADPRPELAGVGPALFPPELRDTPFRRWLEDSGELFGCSFSSSADLPPSFWWCANTSLKRSFLLDGRLFDERLDKEAWDDYELGLRLFDRGMEVRYVPEAVALHEHPVTPEERAKVMRNAGEAAAIMDSFYPRPHRFWSGTDPAESTVELTARAALLRARHRLLRRPADGDAAYSATMRRAFIEGYRSRAWS